MNDTAKAMTTPATDLIGELNAIRAGVDAFNPDARLAARSAFDAAERVWKLVPTITDALAAKDARIEELVEALRHIHVGSDNGLKMFAERQGKRKSPIWYSVNVLQDNLEACAGTARAALQVRER